MGLNPDPVLDAPAPSTSDGVPASEPAFEMQFHDVDAPSRRLGSMVLPEPVMIRGLTRLEPALRPKHLPDCSNQSNIYECSPECAAPLPNPIAASDRLPYEAPALTALDQAEVARRLGPLAGATFEPIDANDLQQATRREPTGVARYVGEQLKKAQAAGVAFPSVEDPIRDDMRRKAIEVVDAVLVVAEIAALRQLTGAAPVLQVARNAAELVRIPTMRSAMRIVAAHERDRDKSGRPWRSVIWRGFLAAADLADGREDTAQAHLPEAWFLRGQQLTAKLVVDAFGTAVVPAEEGAAHAI